MNGEASELPRDVYRLRHHDTVYDATTTMPPTITGYQRKQVEATAMPRQLDKGRTPRSFNPLRTVPTTTDAESCKRGHGRTSRKSGHIRQRNQRDVLRSFTTCRRSPNRIAPSAG